jgi:hypothetical protein
VADQAVREFGDLGEQLLRGTVEVQRMADDLRTGAVRANSNLG